MGELAGGGIVRVQREPSSLEAELEGTRIEELDAMSGLGAYEGERGGKASAGADLLGRTDQPVVQLPLERAIALAVERNLDYAAARLSPSISAALLQQAEAAFDVEVFADADFTKLDTPGPITSNLVPGLSGDRRSETLLLGAGLRKRLAATNGTLSVETRLSRIDDDPSLQGVAPFYDADALVTLQQPLLRNFGREVATSDIVLARNAEAAETQRLRGTLINLVDEVETAYWELLFNRQQLLIQGKLLERTITERDRLKLRQEFDASPVDVTEANSFVELRRLDVINAREAWRNASDRLKRLINAPELSLGDETLIVPLDRPVDAPISFSLLDAVTTALQNRPELRVALLSIADAGVRLTVADNQLLPQLDLSAQLGLGGAERRGRAGRVRRARQGDFVDYLVSLDFSYPLGNRRGRGARLAAAAGAGAEHAGLPAARAGRGAGGEERAAVGGQRVPADRRRPRRPPGRGQQPPGDPRPGGGRQRAHAGLRRPQAPGPGAAGRRGDAEASSRSQYMVSISELYRSTGTLLERNGIDFRGARRTPATISARGAAGRAVGRRPAVSAAPTPAAERRILTGLQPSGQLHLGNYCGAIQPLFDAAGRPDRRRGSSSSSPATTRSPASTDPAALRANCRQVVIDYLAFGLDPARVNLYLQQDVPAVTELAWLLACVCPKSAMDKQVAFKEKVARGAKRLAGALHVPGAAGRRHPRGSARRRAGRCGPDAECRVRA